MPHRVIAGASRTSPQALLSAGMVQALRLHLRTGCLVLFHGQNAQIGTSEFEQNPTSLLYFLPQSAIIILHLSLFLKKNETENRQAGLPCRLGRKASRREGRSGLNKRHKEGVWAKRCFCCGTQMFRAKNCCGMPGWKWLWPRAPEKAHGSRRCSGSSPRPFLPGLTG